MFLTISVQIIFLDIIENFQLMTFFLLMVPQKNFMPVNYDN